MGAKNAAVAASRFVIAGGVVIAMSGLLTPPLWEWCYAIGGSVIDDDTYSALRGELNVCGVLAGVLAAIAITFGDHNKPGLLAFVSTAAGFTASLAAAMSGFQWPVVMWTFWLSPSVFVVLVPLAQRFCESLKTGWNRREKLVDRV